MNTQRAAEIQVVLEGIRLPATRRELIAHASLYDAAVAAELAVLPDRAYDRIDEVGEALLRVQPVTRVTPHSPKPESGLPPGGDSYVLRQDEARPGGHRADARQEHAPIGRGLL
jgi:hypothetical protein